jgi:hypothetical protein
MVQRTLQESARRVKLAEADSSADGEDTDIASAGKGSPKPASPNPNTTPDRNEQSQGEKTSSVNTAYVNKLASAIEFINTRVKLAEEVGPGTGPNALETNVGGPTPGTQNYETGQATSQNVIPKNPGAAPASEAGNTAPATSLDNNEAKKPGGDESWADKDVLKQGSAALQERTKVAGVVGRVLSVMKKVAEDMSPAVSASGEGVPALPGPAASQAALVSSNEAATNYTKRQAKAEPKAQMGEVLSEPAQVTSTDPVLQNNLSETAQAGTKISSVKTAAAARALLIKVAEEGCAEGASPEAKEKAEKLKELLAKQEKTSGMGVGQQAAMPIGGGF